jgi:hypothetical protein
MEKDLFEKKLQSFKEWWLRIKGSEPSEKVQWYFKKGMEKQIEMTKREENTICGERHFDDDDVLLLDDEHYPTPTEYKDCKRAFRLGIVTNMSVPYV